MKVNPRKILEKARKENYAIGAFNAANIETIKAVVSAAKKMDSPVIIEASSGEVGFIGHRQIRSLVDDYMEELKIPIILNLDHSHTLPAVKKAIDAGFDYIHIDGAKRDYSDNVSVTKKVVQLCRNKGIMVEGEMDKITGSSSDRRKERASDVQKEGKYTDPKKALKFVSETKIDTLAVFIGNVHGIYSSPPKLDFERLSEISEKLDLFLSLHGGSGIKGADIKKAIKTGNIVKVNVNSELRIAFRETLEKTLDTSKEIAIYKIMPPVIEAVQAVVEEKIKLFGSAGKI